MSDSPTREREQKKHEVETAKDQHKKLGLCAAGMRNEIGKHNYNDSVENVCSAN